MAVTLVRDDAAPEHRGKRPRLPHLVPARLKVDLGRQRVQVHEDVGGGAKGERGHDGPFETRLERPRRRTRPSPARVEARSRPPRAGPRRRRARTRRTSRSARTARATPRGPTVRALTPMETPPVVGTSARPSTATENRRHPTPRSAEMAAVGAGPTPTAPATRTPRRMAGRGIDDEGGGASGGGGAGAIGVGATGAGAAAAAWEDAVSMAMVTVIPPMTLARRRQSFSASGGRDQSTRPEVSRSSTAPTKLAPRRPIAMRRAYGAGAFAGVNGS